MTRHAESCCLIVFTALVVLSITLVAASADKAVRPRVQGLIPVCDAYVDPSEVTAVRFYPQQNEAYIYLRSGQSMSIPYNQSQDVLKDLGIQ